MTTHEPADQKVQEPKVAYLNEKLRAHPVWFHGLKLLRAVGFALSTMGIIMALLCILSTPKIEFLKSFLEPRNYTPITILTHIWSISRIALPWVIPGFILIFLSDLFLGRVMVAPNPNNFDAK
jgi:hypothetical protein